MKTFSRALITAIFFTMFVSGTSSAAESHQCTDDSLTTFHWEWSTENPESEAPVDITSFGTVVHTDIAYRAIQVISINDDGTAHYDCIFAHSPWKEIEWDGCNRAIEREYKSIFGRPLLTQVKECLSVDGIVTKISGATLNGNKFTSSRPVTQ